VPARRGGGGAAGGAAAGVRGARRCSRVMVKMAWEREECLFMPVAAVARRAVPSSSTRAISSRLRTSRSAAPLSTMPPLGSSRMWTPVPAPRWAACGASRSRMSSLWISTNPTRTVKSTPWDAPTRSKISAMARGMTPGCSAAGSCGKADPMVKVFPEPVCP
jgi:hypothetical protein